MLIISMDLVMNNSHSILELSPFSCNDQRILLPEEWVCTPQEVELFHSVAVERL